MTHVEPTPQCESGAPEAAVAAALGRIPSGLFVVTWRGDGRDRAMLASWVMQAGFQPPLVSIAVAPERDLLAAVREGATFVVNVLAEDQRPLVGRFGRPAGSGEDPFAGVAVGRSPAGAPTLDGVAAWLECRAAAPPVRGADDVDHLVLLGRVVAAAARDLQPLVHLRRNGLRY